MLKFLAQIHLLQPVIQVYLRILESVTRLTSDFTTNIFILKCRLTAADLRAECVCVHIYKHAYAIQLLMLYIFKNMFVCISILCCLKEEKIKSDIDEGQIYFV